MTFETQITYNTWPRQQHGLGQHLDNSTDGGQRLFDLLCCLGVSVYVYMLLLLLTHWGRDKMAAILQKVF